MKTKPMHAFIAITVIFFIVWLGVTERKWEARGCTNNSLSLAMANGEPEWDQFCGSVAK